MLTSGEFFLRMEKILTGPNWNDCFEYQKRDTEKLEKKEEKVSESPWPGKIEESESKNASAKEYYTFL